MPDSVTNPTTFDEALHYFEALEQRLGLSCWKIKGVYVWKLVRFEVFSKYLQCHGIIDEPHPEANRLRKAKWRLVLDFLKPVVTRNPFLFSIKGYKRIIIPHDRKAVIHGRLVDVHSYRAWAGDPEDSLVLDKTSPINPYPLQGAPDYNVLVRLAWMRRQFIRVRLSQVDHDRIADIAATLGLSELRLSSQIIKQTKVFLSLESVFTLFLKIARPTYLYVVVSYGKEAPISAARKLGIYTVEFQHGALGRGHLAYDYNKWQSVPYFPDCMLALGPDWFYNVNLPEHCMRHYIGSKYMDREAREALQLNTKQTRHLLALSQGPVSARLLHVVAEFHQLRPDWSIVVRPHPSERVSQLESVLSAALGADEHGLVVDQGTPLLDQAATATVVLGVNSTAVAEAALVGCRVSLLAADGGAQLYQKLVDDGDAVVINSGRELAQQIDGLAPCGIRGYFADPVQDVTTLV